MTAREYLDRLRETDADIDAMHVRKEGYQKMLNTLTQDYIDKATQITVDFSKDRIQSGGQSSVVENVAVQMADNPRRQELKDKIKAINEQIDNQIDELVTMKETARTLLSAITIPNYRRVLEYRYIDNLQWETIADIMHYRYRHITRMHGYALLEFAKYVPKCPLD